jgi:hypothetical protein
MHRLTAKHSAIRRHLYAYRYGGHSIDAQLPYEPGSMAFDSDVPQAEQAREHLWPHILAFLSQI